MLIVALGFIVLRACHRTCMHVFVRACVCLCVRACVCFVSYDLLRVGAVLAIQLENFHFNAQTQLVLTMDSDAPFPHFTNVSFTFLTK